MRDKNIDSISTKPILYCIVCSEKGEMLYSGLIDNLFGAPGTWSLRKCTNRKCGLLWLDPMPSEGEIIKAYKNYYTHYDHSEHSTDIRVESLYKKTKRMIKEGYLAQRYGYQKPNTSILKRSIGILAYLNPVLRNNLDFRTMYLHAKPNGNLLEIGCGSGQTLNFMNRLGWRVQGLDFDAISVRKAQSKGINVHLGTLEEQKYPDNHFDSIIMSHVIEHVHEPLNILSESKRILKPGGQLTIATPNSKSLGHMLFKDSWRGLEPPRHLHVFSPESLNYLTQKAGFNKIRLFTTVRDANNLFIASKFIKHHNNCNFDREAYTIRFLGLAIQLVEWLIINTKLNLGEEIILLAEK